MHGPNGNHYIAYNAPAMLASAGEKGEGRVDNHTDSPERAQRLEMELIQVKSIVNRIQARENEYKIQIDGLKAERNELKAEMHELRLAIGRLTPPPYSPTAVPTSPKKPPRPASPKIDIPPLPPASAPSARYNEGEVMDIHSDDVS